jgi:hypothetical protein
LNFAVGHFGGSAPIEKVHALRNYCARSAFEVGEESKTKKSQEKSRPHGLGRKRN